MPTLLFDLLEQIRKERMAKGDGNPYIFPDKGGRPYNNDTLDTAWPKICTALGLPLTYRVNASRKRIYSPTYYSLKHLGIADADRSGTPASIIKEKAGWSTTRMMDRYRVLLSNELQQERELLDARIAARASGTHGTH